MDIEGLDLGNDDVVLSTSRGLQKYGEFRERVEAEIVSAGFERYFRKGVEIQFLKTTGGG